MVGYAFTEARQKPAWLEALHIEKFFVGCLTHENAKKNEKNILCLDCCKSICPHCLPAHRAHRLLQVRRYVYHDVVRLEDLEKLIDCSYVQAYTINSAKVVFLNQRPQTRPFKGSGNTCSTCDRSLQEPYFHCSIGCKVDYLLKRKRDLSEFLYECKSLSLSEFVLTHTEGLKTDNSDLEEGEMTPNSILERGTSFGMSSSGSGANNGSTLAGYRNIACTATTEFVKKKRSGYNNNNTVYGAGGHPYYCARTASSESINRRKSTPHRSPLF